MTAHTLCCPICEQPVLTAGADPATAPHRPFCSLRCKLVDLDRWFSGDYRIPGPPSEVEPGSTDTGTDPAIRDEQGA
ncbi:MAG: DNA gyrase inhibitor YacG [Myxococcota bacterium]